MKKFVVTDCASGNWQIYNGYSINEAIEAIINDGDIELWDLHANGDRMWCGATDTLKELKNLANE
jgi:hypothetical protein